MNKQFTSYALCAFLSAGLTLAAQDLQNQPAPPQADQSQNTQQPNRGGRPVDPQRQLHSLTKKLALTADQQNQILPILTDRHQQTDAILNDASLSVRDKHSKIKALREESETNIRAVLNDSQKQKYDQMQEQLRERARQRRENQQNGQGSSSNS